MADALQWAPPGEKVLWASRPHPLYIFLRRLFTVLALAALAFLLASITVLAELEGLREVATFALAVAAAAVLMWSALVWLNQTFVLTERRALWASGVIRRLIVEVPLDRIQNVAVYRSLRERLFGLGTVGIATAGTGSFEIAWPMVRAPLDVHQRILAARDEAAKTPPVSTPSSHPSAPAAPTPPPPRIPVIGLAGGIGAGKSAVAAAMSRQGCLVLDADQEAKAALDRPEVREKLREWWGDRILLPMEESGAGGRGQRRVDRRAVAAIVFTDPAERRRLEQLIHPLVQQARAAAIADARRRSALPDATPPRAIVIDAPLLFEAGVDRECDIVVFVDAPREARLERVRTSRGWDEPELARREAAQLPLEEKRRRSQIVIMNASPQADVDNEVAALLARISAVLPPPPAPGPKGG